MGWLNIGFEFILIALLIIGFANEDKLIEFEHELYIVLRQYFRKKMRGRK